MSRPSENRQQIGESSVRRHHRVVADAERVDVFDDLFFLRIEYLPIARIRRLIQETAVRRDRAVLRLDAEAHVERLDDFVANRVDERDRAADFGGHVQLVLRGRRCLPVRVHAHLQSSCCA